MGRTRIAGVATVAALALLATANHHPERPSKADMPSIPSGAGPIRSAPLRDLPPAARTRQLRWPVRTFRGSRLGAPAQPMAAPPAEFAGTLGLVRRAATALSRLVFPTLGAIPATDKNFDGVGNGFSGPQGTFSVNAAPPDTNGDVGPNHYVQIVNTDFAVFDKNGVPLYGPVPINTLWSGFGGGCQTNNDGDPTVIYDPIADRWIISQFSVTTTPFMQCVAVSATSDPTGAYNRYAFQYSNFPDYPKLGVWPDAYYTTFNMFNASGTAFLGAQVCAYDRLKMLAGQPATQQCFTTSTSFGGLLPADLDGARQPPAGSPNYVVALGASGGLAYWNFHVDWTTPANSTFAGPTTLATAAYSEACGGRTCIPQSGTTQQLDSLADRLMYRLAYRNFGDHEALVVNHSIAAGGSVGVRWYELRVAGGNLAIFQQGTYAPDSSYRWMGSIAMDQVGDIGLGYSVSSSSLHPAIRYTGRLTGDPAGQMTQGEGTIIAGAGSQTGNSLSRWGDYSMIAVDPSDDCTFWYTSEYIPSNGAFNWRTRIGSFRFPSCGPTPTDDFSISASPSSLTLAPGASGSSTIATVVTSGSAQTISLTVSGVPSGATASLNPTSVTTGGSSSLTINAGSAIAGTYTLMVTGTSPSATHSTTVTLTVAQSNDFSIGSSPSSLSIAQGTSGNSIISTAVTSGAGETISFTVSGVPSGAAASISPPSVTAGTSATLTINAGTAVPGTYTVTITGASPSATHSTTVTLTVTGSASTIVNGGFETGNLTGWVSLGSTAVVTGGHSGNFSARVGNTGAFPGDSTIQQDVAVPAGGAALSFWVKRTCTDTITYDWQRAQIRNTSGTVLATIFNTCTTDANWTQMTYSLNPWTGTTIRITFLAHDDNWASPPDPTYMLVDDVTVGSPPPPPPNPIVNGGFETGNLSGWTSLGVTAVVTGGHSGTYAARVGSTSAFSGDSSLSQTFTAPAVAATLSFWYKTICPDTVVYDWTTVTLTDNTAGATTTILARACTNTGTWTNRNAALVAGHSYTLRLISHDDNWPTDPTYTLFDDIAVVGSRPIHTPTDADGSDGRSTRADRDERREGGR